jgi:hypothetical protein
VSVDWKKVWGVRRVGAHRRRSASTGRFDEHGGFVDGEPTEKAQRKVLERMVEEQG